MQAVSQDDFDTIQAALDVGQAKLVVNQKVLELAIAGPGKEDVAQAEAQLAASQQALDLAIAGARKEDVAQAEAQLRAAERRPPCCGSSWRKRSLSHRSMPSSVHASWSRARWPRRKSRLLAGDYRSQVGAGLRVRAGLCKLHPGMAASVTVDSFPDRHFDGWVGFVSPVAEFTPKAVQTEGAADEPGLRSPCVREGPVGRVATGHAGHDASDVGKRGWKRRPTAMIAIDETRAGPCRPRSPQDISPRDGGTSSMRSTACRSWPRAARSPRSSDRTAPARPRSFVWPPG